MDRKEFAEQAVELMGELAEKLIDKNTAVSLIVSAELMIRVAIYMGVDRDDYLERLRKHWQMVEQEDKEKEEEEEQVYQ